LGGLGQWEHDRGMFLVNYMTSSSDPRANILPRSIFGF